MVCMAISCALSFVLPIALLLYFKIKKGADLLPFFVGCAVMLLFAFILERAAHGIILGSPAGAVIQGNLWLYALYGGLMAGLFEETGRLLAFKTVLHARQSQDINALMYGAGHGGFEAMVILGITSINNLIYSVMINSGNTAALTESLSGDLLAQVEQVIQALSTTPSYLFLLGAVERIFAIVLHLAFSVLVWFAVKYGKRFLYPLAIALHFAVDALTVIVSGLGAPVVLLEALVGVMAFITAGIAWKVWKEA